MKTLSTQSERSWRIKKKEQQGEAEEEEFRDGGKDRETK